ncbi:MAG: arginine--tRNA ligase [Calditrichaeota bacterium]|nr:arginine--tRNA ligase [Calditrichota bacterium]
MRAQEYIRQSIKKALEKAGFDAHDEKLLNLEKPKQEGFGDIASPVAMNLAKIARQAPRKIAESIIEHFEIDPFYLDKIEIAGPGFLNFFLAANSLQQSVLDILAEADAYGSSDWGNGEKIQFEFVSANPTGPLNIVSARAAAVGDVLAALANAAGYKAQREFYVNDAGRQIKLLGASLSARYMTELGKSEPVPEEGYHGEYLIDLAKEIIAAEGKKYAALDISERQKLFSQKALQYMLNRQKNSLEKYRLKFDNWFHESTIRAEKAHLKILDTFKKSNLSYEQDGAVWFKSSEFGDEKDRVLITGEGEPTYFLIDIAYHETKYARGFTQVHDLWGPDHHGYIARMSAAMQALGHPVDSFHVWIIQQVNLLRAGEIIKMSKRAGKIIEMDELLDEVGVDAARYFFIDRRMSQPLDFDIELAKKKSDENPVYYVQYAHARISNILRHARENGIEIPLSASTALLKEKQEMAVVKKLIDFPEVISKAAQFLEPHRLTTFLHELATIFHRFYHDHRVVTENRELTLARLMLCKATQQVLANGLKLLGITAPKNM